MAREEQETLQEYNAVRMFTDHQSEAITLTGSFSVLFRATLMSR
jgi:hypothetical protein